MKWLRKIRFKLGALFTKDKFNAEMESEMRIHLELRTEKNLAAGCPAAEARNAALRAFGGLDQIKERARDQRDGAWIRRLVQDLQYGWRMLRKNPGFTAVAILSLALGIGAGTAIFSLVNGILLSSLPVPNPSELRDLSWYSTGKNVWESGINGIAGDDAPDGPGGQRRHDGFSLPAFLALRRECEAQADIFAYKYVSGVTARAHSEAVSVQAVIVSGNFFPGLGVHPLIGTLIGAKDDSVGAPSVAVISYRWWEEQYARDPGALGQQVNLNGHSFTIVGILPRDFLGARPGTPDDLYVPLSAWPQLMVPGWDAGPTSWWLPMMARLLPGASGAQLQAAMDAGLKGATVALAKKPGNEIRAVVANGSGGADWQRGYYRQSLFMLLGVVAVVLLVACANLAGLLLARGAARRHEFSVRIALGAGRRRLVQQLLTESGLLGVLGGGCGILVAIWGRIVISRLLAGSSQELHYDTSLDPRVLGFALAVSLATALIFGLLPALKAGTVDPVAGLKDRGGSGAISRLRAGPLLVVAQIALSLLLVAGGGLYVRTLINLVRIDPGYSIDHLILFKLSPGNVGYKDTQTAAFYQRVQDSLAAIPGVNSVALAQYPSLANWHISNQFQVLDHPATMDTVFTAMVVSERFFPTLGIPLVLGRGLKASDSDAAPKVAVVNQAFVRKFLPGEFPIGQRLSHHGDIWEIVGVCRDIKYERVQEETPPTGYFSFRQKPAREAYFIMRTSLAPQAIAAAARKVVASIDRNVPVTDFATQGEIRAQTFKTQRTFATLCGSLAILALFLSCIGLYGLMAYDVTRRTTEIGIRQALGATRRQIAAPIVRRAMALAGFGVALGMPLTVVLTRLIQAALYGLKPSDPITLCGAVFLLLAVALIASWLPAHRAARVDPMVALRTE